jgi:hypothetical protein
MLVAYAPLLTLHNTRLRDALKILKMGAEGPRPARDEKTKDAAQEAGEKSGEEAGSWDSSFQLLREFKEEQGTKWLGVVKKKIQFKGRPLGQWCKRQRQLKSRSQLATHREKSLKEIGFIFGEDALQLLSSPKAINRQTGVPIMDGGKASKGKRKSENTPTPINKRKELPSERLKRKKAKLRAEREATKGKDSKMEHTDSDSLSVFARGLRELAQGGDDELVDSIPLHEREHRLFKSERKDNMKIKTKKSEEEGQVHQKITSTWNKTQSNKKRPLH